MHSKHTLIITILIIILIQCTYSACNTTHPYAYGSGCFKECPWNNTLITYLQNDTTCLTNCDSGSFADDSTKKCVTTCPSTPILTYYDMKYNRCVSNCSNDNLQFAAPNNTCVANCPSPTYGLGLTGICMSVCPLSTYYMVFNAIRLCVNICYPNYYADVSRTCVSATSCPSSPVAYFGDDSTGLCVTDCPASKGTFADNSTRKCVIYCPLGSFADLITRKCVATCPSVPSYFGSNVTRNCLLQCNEGEFADVTTRQCTFICPANYYGDYSTRKCVKLCPASQNTFADPLTNLCVKICPANYYGDKETQYCVLAINCSNNTYGDPITQLCVQQKECSVGLFVDIDIGMCVLRCTTWANPLTGFCEATCPWNPPNDVYFKDASTRKCVSKCPVSPRTFGDPITRNCQAVCTTGYYADPSTLLCVTQCPEAFYSNALTSQCVASCTQNSSIILFFQKITSKCVAQCPLDYFADNSTLSCEYTCLNYTYGYVPTKQCLSNCPDGWFGDNYTVRCVQSCPMQNGQYADPSTNLCVNVCPSNPDLYGQDLNDNNLTCVTACTIPGFFADPLTRLCVYKCNSSAGYYGDPSDGRCYLRCPTGYGNPLTSQCIAKCPRVPKFFYGDNLTGICVLSCPNQTYGDPNNNLCVTAKNCSAGLYGDDITGWCVPVCSQLLNLYGDQVENKCVDVCTFPYYADPVTQKCALTCSANYYRDNSTSQCVRLCSSLPAYYGDPNSGYCQYNCTLNWFAYSSATQRICLAMCPSNPPMLADLQNFKCVLACANNTFSFINNTFRGCLDYCPPQVYNSSLQVDLFADNTTWQCVVVCPYGFYSFVHPTNSTIRLCVRYCPKVGSTFYYAEDTKRQCVTNCPLLYQFTYGDSIDFRCSSVCSRNQYKDNSTATCVYKCPNGTYANNVTWNCSATCNEGYFAENINNTCVKTCPTNLYGYNRVCISQCPNNTLQYKDNTTWLCVSRCPSYPNYFADNSSVACVLQCPLDYYADVGTRTCVLPINCTEPTIADPVSRRCVLQCPKNPVHFLMIQQNLCVVNCTNGTFAYNQTNICVNECPQPYFGVNTTTYFYCTQYCPSLQYMWVNKTSITTRMCVPFCPTGLFRDNLTMKCVQICPDYSYANISNNLCVTSCSPLYADDLTKTCVQLCPNGTTASNASRKCQQYCDYGQFMLNNTCQPGCPSGYYADNLTRSCLKKCPYDPLTYADPLNHKCVFNCSATQYAFLSNLTCSTSCPLGFFKQQGLLLCLQKCLQGFYSDNTSQSCISSCNQSAAYPYADPTSQTCVNKCPSDPDLYGLNNKCVTQCDLGFFAENVTRTCVSVCPNASSTYNASWADDLTRKCLAKCSSLSYAYTNITHNVCINVCPTGYFASIIDQACLAECPPGTFAHVNTSTCVDQCPSGLWADLVLRICMQNCTYNSSLYADDSSTSCVEVCPTYPDMYADDTTQKCVLSCPNNSYAYTVTRKCVSDCPFPYFADTYKLQCVLACRISEIAYADSVLRKCVSGCTNHTINETIIVNTTAIVNVTNSTNTTTNTTDSNTTTNSTTNTTNTTMTIIISTPTNITVNAQFYSDNSTLTCVRQCPQFPNRLYAQNISGTCMQSCPSGTFGDNDTRVCLDKCVFQNPKFTWQDKLNNFCTTLCPYSYFADNITGSCELQCSNGTFADQSSRRCVVNCPINPASYSTIVAGKGVCVYNCPNGTFSSEVSISCVTSCPTSPSTYYKYPPTNACVKECVYPYYADKDLQACTTSCKVGYYGNKTLKSCEACQVQCVTCSGYLVCTSCVIGFYLYQITCVVSCPTYPVLYYAHKQSSVCYLTCPAPFFGQPSNGLCQLTCASLQYANTATRTCTACPQGCRICSSVGCTSCLTSYTFLPSALACNKDCNSTAKYYFKNICYTSCPAGSYLTYDLVHCLACSSPCATCIGLAGNCTSCIQSYYYLGQCLNACPTNFYIDDKLNCISCTVNPQKCVLPPLTYKITTFKAGFDLKAYCVFSRAVNLTLQKFQQTVQIKYNGATLKISDYSASVFNSTTFLISFASYISQSSLNQNSLSFSFTPGTISDQYGNVLTTVTVSQNVTIVTGVNSQVVSASKPVQNTTVAISLSILVLLGLLLIKKNYAALIAFQCLQLMHLHIFLYWNPLPYLQYKFLDSLRYFNLMFFPTPFAPLNITNQYYSIFTSDVSFLSNCPIIVFMSVIIFIYWLVGILSSKKLMSNKHVRKLFKKIRKHRVKYNLLYDACWIIYPYAMVISLLQFKFGTIGTTMQTLNIALSALTFIVLNCVVLYLLFLAHKYRKNADKIPKKFSFIQLEASQNTLEMPVRYVRKLGFALALLLPTFQSQLVGFIAINLSFLCMYLCYRPSKTPLTNYVCIFMELLMIVYEGVYYGYDKLDVKSTNSQYGFSIGMIIVQITILLGMMAWIIYRLIIVIRDADMWKVVYERITRNTDPQYLRQQQRKRDLEFDFGGLDANSMDQRTDHALEKLSAKREVVDEKFNIFDQAEREDSQRDLQKPFKMQNSIRRPSSMESSQKIALRSQSSQARGLFEPNKSANNYRKRNHLQIRHRQQQNSVDEVLIEGNESMVEITKKKETKGGKEKVLWEDIQFDDEEI